jgi:hypothetical protein
LKKNLPTNQNIYAVEIKNEWLKVKWDIELNPNNDSNKTDYGWVKWKEDGKLLIKWFYFS